MNRWFFFLNLAGIGLLVFPFYLLVRFAMFLMSDLSVEEPLFEIGISLLLLIGLVYIVLILNCVYFFVQERGKKHE